jgi:hypothetical protein
LIKIELDKTPGLLDLPKKLILIAMRLPQTQQSLAILNPASTSTLARRH